MCVSSQSWALPACPTTGYKHNCFGSYTDQDGDKYLGEWKDNQFNGKGVWTSADGRKYSGQFKDGTMHGQGTLISAQRDKYVGKFKDGKKHGKGSYSWINGDKYLGEYKDNNEHGQGTFTWENNGDKYIGEWKNGYANGQGTMSFGDGDKYVGKWKDSQFNGQGTLILSNGEKYEGKFKKDQFNGQGKFTYADGRVEEGIFKDNKFMYTQKIQKTEKKYLEVSRIINMSGELRAQMDDCEDDTFVDSIMIDFGEKDNYIVNLCSSKLILESFKDKNAVNYFIENCPTNFSKIRDGTIMIEENSITTSYKACANANSKTLKKYSDSINKIRFHAVDDCPKDFRKIFSTSKIDGCIANY